MTTQKLNTPWGIADSITELAPGILEVSTPSHGGILLDQTLNQQIPEVFRREHGDYEQDINWAAAYYFLFDYIQNHTKDPDIRTKNTSIRKVAKVTLTNFRPHPFTQATGIPIQPEYSIMLKREAFYEKHKNDWVVTSVPHHLQNLAPHGFVIVTATLGGVRSPEPSQQTQFLVSIQEHEKTTPPMIIDLSRHISLDPSITP